MAECQDDLDVLDQNCDGKIKASELGSLVEDLGAPKGEDGLQKLHTETDVEKVAQLVPMRFWPLR